MPGMTPDETALLLTLQFAIAFLGFVIAASIRLQISEKHMHIFNGPDANEGCSDLLDQVPELPSPRPLAQQVADLGGTGRLRPMS